MISERSAAESFDGFWKELLPLMTPRFVYLFNEGYIDAIRDSDGNRLEPVIVSEQNNNPPIVAEAAFFMAKFASNAATPIAKAVKDRNLVEAARIAAAQLVASYQKDSSIREIELSPAEINEAKLLTNIYGAFLALFLPSEIVEFSPSIPGSGFVSACQGDLSIGETLFEIKTTTKNIAGKHLRQLIVYLALQAATGSRRWTRAGFFNPRRACFYVFSIDDLLFRLSGGRSAIEVFHDLISFVGSREMQSDTAF